MRWAVMIENDRFSVECDSGVFVYVKMNDDCEVNCSSYTKGKRAEGARHFEFV